MPVSLEIPYHLALPLAASILFVVGFMLIKRAGSQGVATWTVTFCANMWAALVISSLWLMGEPGQPRNQIWQSAIIGVLYGARQDWNLTSERGRQLGDRHGWIV